MANFQNNALTDSGRVLLSHVQMGAVFTPTKIVIGSGVIPSGKTPKTMSGVVEPVMELALNKKQRTNDGKVIVGGMYSNQDIDADWYFRELALYAKAVYADGTVIAEILYSYGNAGDTADLMPAYTSGQPVERQIDIITYIGSDAQVDLTIDPGVAVTVEMLERIIAELGPSNHAATHAADGADPIYPGNIGAAVANGVLVNGSDLNDVTYSGMYRFDSVKNAPPGVDYSQMLVIHGGGDTITQIVGFFSTGAIWTRSGNPTSVGGNGGWTEWKQLATTDISSVEVHTATIGTSWTENEDTGVKSQSVSIPGVLASHTAKVDHAYTGNGSSDSYATFVEEENQYLEFITNGYAETYDGGITFHIFGDVNTVSIPIVVEVA